MNLGSHSGVWQLPNGAITVHACVCVLRQYAAGAANNRAAWLGSNLKTWSRIHVIFTCRTGWVLQVERTSFSMLQEQCLVLPATSIKQHFAFKCCALSVPLSTEKGICHALSLDKTASLQNLCFRACWVFGNCCCSSDTPTQVTKLVGKSMHQILNRSQSGCFP